MIRLEAAPAVHGPAGARERGGAAEGGGPMKTLQLALMGVLAVNGMVMVILWMGR